MPATSYRFPILNRYDARYHICPDRQLANCDGQHCGICYHCQAHCRCAMKRYTPLRAAMVVQAASGGLPQGQLAAPTSSTFTLPAPTSQVCRKCNLRRTLCQCKRCTACFEAKDACRCPFPSKQFPWGKAQYEQDIEGLEAMGQANSKLFAAGIITGMEFTKSNRHIDAMAKRCRSKLFAIAKRMQDNEADFKAASKTAVAMTILHPSTNSFGATLSAAEIARLQAIDKKGW